MKKVFILFALFLAVKMVSAQPYTVEFTVDMTDAIGQNQNIPFNPAEHEVYIAGAFPAPLTWQEPGTNEACKMTLVSGNLYSITYDNIPAGTLQFKFFFAPFGDHTWQLGEWEGDPNRSVDISENTTVFKHFGWKIGMQQINFAGVSVYPNPSNGMFNVQSNKTCNLEVIDLAGRVVYKSEIVSGVNPVDLSATQAGMYFFKFIDGNNTYNERVIIK